MFEGDVSSYLTDVLRTYEPLFFLLLGLAVLLLVLLGINRTISKIRERGIITRSAESKLRFLIALIGFVAYATYALSLFHVETVWITIVILASVLGLILYSMRSYFENLFTFIIISSSGLLREGERVVIKLGEEVVEGYVADMNENYVVIRTSHNALVYIPNASIARAVIVRPSQATLRIRLSVSTNGGGEIDVEHAQKLIRDAIARSKLVNKTSIEVKPVEVLEDSAIFMIEVNVLNPRNIDECYTEIVNLLRASLPYKRIRTELVE